MIPAMDPAMDPGPSPSSASALARERFDAHAGSRLRGALLAPLTLVWALLASLIVAIIAVIAPRWFKRRGWFLVNLWGRLPLWWHGIRVELHGREQLQAPGPRIVLFNHVSVLDLFVLSAISPPNVVVVYKEEFKRVPGIGRALRALNCIPVDRSDPERSRESMTAAGERLRETGGLLLIAPEGTRSRKGGLQAFKLGAFHMAIQTGAPLVPLIMRGIEQVSPIGSVLIRPGRIRVDLLPPIDPTGWTPETVRDHAQAVRTVFLEYLDPAIPCRTPAAVLPDKGAR